MAQFFSPPPQQPQNNYAPNNLNFYQSSYGSPPLSGSSPAAQPYGMGFGGMGSMGSMGNMGSTLPSGERGGLTTGWLAALGTSGYEDEPPLLEELGVNFSHIKLKTLAVLNPLKTIEPTMMEDSDVAGPIVFCLLYATFLLLSGKVHFGYVYGIAVFGSASLHFLLSLMSPTPTLNYIRSASIIGYCLLPLVFTSMLGVAYPLDGPIGYGLSVGAIFWSTASASNWYVSVLRAQDVRWLVAYPLALFYSVFGIMTIFGSKASVGGLAGRI